MKILITGAKGQLGRDLVRMGSDTHTLVPFCRTELDVTNQEQTLSIIRSTAPNVIIHAAAYTAVDTAESHEEYAFRVNAIGARNIMVAAEQIGAKVCYVSTDYVFDGNGDKPYGEYDITHPTSVYGKSKLAGEQLTQSLSSRYFIVRTSWLYGCYGNNFVKTMLKLGAERESLRVVNDQIGSPTYTVDLARFLLQLVTTESYGIYHASNSGVCSWYEFAKEIFAEAGMSTSVIPCTTAEFPRPAPRPKYSVLGNMAIRTNGFRPLQSWQDALHAFMKEYVAVRKGVTYSEDY